MNQLSPEAKRLIKLARRDDTPGEALERRVERSLARKVALGAAAGAGATLISNTAAGARVLLLAAKIVGVGGAVVGTGWLVSRGTDAGQPVQTMPARTPSAAERAAAKGPAPQALAAAAPVATAETPVSVAKEAVPSGPAPKKPPLEAVQAPVEEQAPVVELPPPSEPPDRLLAETTDLRRAQQALRAGDPALALRLVEEQERQHGDGVLQQERAALGIFALCESGQAAKARAEAAKFEARWPDSSLVARVRASCREATQ